MELVITIGADTDERSVAVSICDDEPFMPDLIDHLMTRIAVGAITVWRELHPIETPTGYTIPAPAFKASLPTLGADDPPCSR